MPPQYEYYTTGDDDVKWLGKRTVEPLDELLWGQTFTPSVGHKVTSVKLKMEHLGTPSATTYVEITATDGGGHPTGAPLCSGTVDARALGTGSTPYPGEWVEISLGAGYDLVADTKYAIVVRSPDSNYPTHRIGLRSDQTSPTYARGNAEYSRVANGPIWQTVLTNDLMFDFRPTVKGRSFGFIFG